MVRCEIEVTKLSDCDSQDESLFRDFQIYSQLLLSKIFRSIEIAVVCRDIVRKNSYETVKKWPKNLNRHDFIIIDEIFEEG